MNRKPALAAFGKGNVSNCIMMSDRGQPLCTQRENDAGARHTIVAKGPDTVSESAGDFALGDAPQDL
jgi:hypothetical protein